MKGNTRAAATQRIECTIRAGRRRHQRHIGLVSKRQYDKSVHEIAVMLAKWRRTGKVRVNDAVIILHDIGAVNISISRNVHVMGGRIRERLQEFEIVALAA